MPMSRAKRLCPQLVVLPPDFELYTAVSAGVMAVFRDLTPLVEPLSLDEAFLDVSGSIRRLGPPAVIAEQIRARVHDEQGITCSVGVASTKFVAKLASTQAKPDGLLVVPADRVVAFLHPLPVGALWGVGDKTEEAAAPGSGCARWATSPTRPSTPSCAPSARPPGSTSPPSPGGATRAVCRCPRARRASATRRPSRATSTTPRSSTASCCACRRRSPRGCAGPRWPGARSSIKVRFADFSTITRSRTLRSPTDVGREVYSTARDLYDALGLQRARLRLVGVKVEGLVDASGAPRQLLLDEPELGWREAEQAVDRAEARFGRGSVRPARLVPGPEESGTDGQDGFGGQQPVAPRPGRG